jgi:hypothetical protein
MKGRLFVGLAVLALRVVNTTATSFKRLCTSCMFCNTKQLV